MNTTKVKGLNGSAAKIGQRMCELRKKKGYTQQQMAERLNISLQHYSNIERGRRRCSIDLFIEVCRILDVHGNELLRDYLPINSSVMEFTLGEKFNELTQEQQSLYFDISEALIERIQSYRISNAANDKGENL
ncbi:helix-turn-helix transcriptional regulator [Blautia schinkii]|nr:helix-turn-helix transcriptional regulator [Blautia schinkii]